jgi:hypothetical protein
MLRRRLRDAAPRGAADSLGRQVPPPAATVVSPSLGLLWDECFSAFEDHSIHATVIVATSRWLTLASSKSRRDANNIEFRFWLPLFEALHRVSPLRSVSECAAAASTGALSPKFSLFQMNGSSISCDGFSGTLADWAVWFLFQMIEEFYDEGVMPLRSVADRRAVTSWRPVRNSYFFRDAMDPTFNFLKKGSIKWDSFSRDRHTALAAELHTFSKTYLTTAAVAARFLKSLGNERAQRILFFGTAGCDYTTFSLWHGLLELGLNVTSVPLRKPRT